MSQVNLPGCFCNGELQNSGLPASQKLFDIKEGMFIVPLLADDGTRNSFNLAAADLDQELLDKVNHSDPSKRWYPYHQLKNVTEEQADATFAEADNGERDKLRNGIKTITEEMWATGHQFFGKVPENCVPFGIVCIDVCGNLLGEKESKTSTLLYPRTVNHRSVDKVFMNKTNNDAQKITLSYDYGYLTSDANQYVVPKSAFSTVDPRQLSGMLDVNLTLEATANDTIVIDAALDFGDAITLTPVEGLVTADFTMINVDDGNATLTITVVESTTTPGRYTATIDAGDVPTAGDELTVSVFKAATANLEKGKEGDAVSVTAV